MNQLGTVSMLNEKTGVAAIQLEDGTSTLAELLGSDPFGLGDKLEGSLTVLGEETLVDMRTGRCVPVFIRAYQISAQAARDEIF